MRTRGEGGSEGVEGHGRANRRSIRPPWCLRGRLARQVVDGQGRDRQQLRHVHRAAARNRFLRYAEDDARFLGFAIVSAPARRSATMPLYRRRPCP